MHMFLKINAAVAMAVIAGCAPMSLGGIFMEPDVVDITYHVQDENGIPISAAQVIAITMSGALRGWTDGNGDCTIRNKIYGDDYTCKVAAPGYYGFRGDFCWGLLPTNTHHVITLSRLVPNGSYRFAKHEGQDDGYPHPTVTEEFIQYEERDGWRYYHSSSDAGSTFWKTPELDRPYGYDLYEDDWVSPHGSGTNVDVYVTQHCFWQSGTNYDFRLALDFPNPGDGISIVDCRPRHPFRGVSSYLPCVAPVDGYTNHFEFAKSQMGEDYAYLSPTSDDPNDISTGFGYEPRGYVWMHRMFFRFRSDQTGNAVSAYHGVFHHDGANFLPAIFRARLTVPPPLGSKADRIVVATNRLVCMVVGHEPVYYFNTDRSSRVLVPAERYREEMLETARSYTPPPGARPPVPGSEAFASREVAYDSNSLGMRISREEVGGVRFGLHEVRNRDFRAFRKGHDSAMGTRLKLSGRNQPVVGVSYEDAAAFCAWLTERERSRGSLDSGHLYRLPTCDEWLAAAGIGVVGIETNAYPWGWNWPPPRKLANLFDEGSASKDGFADGIEDYDDGSLLTAPVGSYPPNRRGLYDISGNVWEMSATEADGETDVALHGGSWRTADPDSLHIDSMEVYQGPAHDVGFRVVVAPVASPGAPTPPAPSGGGDEPAVAQIPEAVGTNVLASLGMVPVPAGTLKRFSSIGRPDPNDEYAEIHDAVNLRVTTNFWIAAREVTQAQYEAVMGTNRSSTVGASLPVENVTWDEAMDFCARLTAFARSRNAIPAGYAYSLPTETQWELACVSGATNAWGFGVFDEAGLATNAWYAANSGGTLHPVGTKAPNALGLFDMLGNVFELCSDWHDEAFPTASEDDPQGPPNGDGKVMRGGGVKNAAEECGPEVRLSIPRDERSPYVGFRVALVPEEP